MLSKLEEKIFEQIFNLSDVLKYANNIQESIDDINETSIPNISVIKDFIIVALTYMSSNVNDNHVKNIISQFAQEFQHKNISAQSMDSQTVKNVCNKIMDYVKETSDRINLLKILKEIDEYIPDDMKDKYYDYFYGNVMDETSTTGGVAGYMTPNAFSGKRKSDKSKLKGNAENSGYSLVKGMDETDENVIGEAYGVRPYQQFCKEEGVSIETVAEKIANHFVEELHKIGVYDMLVSMKNSSGPEVTVHYMFNVFLSYIIRSMTKVGIKFEKDIRFVSLILSIACDLLGFQFPLNRIKSAISMNEAFGVTRIDKTGAERSATNKQIKNAKFMTPQDRGVFNHANSISTKVQDTKKQYLELALQAIEKKDRNFKNNRDWKTLSGLKNDFGEISDAQMNMVSKIYIKYV